MVSLRRAAAALLVAFVVGCTGVPVDMPTLSPSPSPTATMTAASSPSDGPMSTPSPTTGATSTATMSNDEALASMFNWWCTRVRHIPLGDFLSYLESGIAFYDANGRGPDEIVDYITITVIGANDDEPVELEYDAEIGAFVGLMGLRGTGAKVIVNVQVHWLDGSVSDATEIFIDDLGSDTFDVRFPEEDEFGDCAQWPDT